MIKSSLGGVSSLNQSAKSMVSGTVKLERLRDQIVNLARSRGVPLASASGLQIHVGLTNAGLFTIKAPFLGSQFPHLFRRLIAQAERFVLAQFLQHFIQAERIGPAEDAATEGRETDAQDQ